MVSRDETDHRFINSATDCFWLFCLQQKISLCAVLQGHVDRRSFSNVWRRRKLSLLVQAYSRLPITIRCREHGNFTQNAYTHLSGKGCKQCGEEAKAEANRLSPSEVLNRFDTIHFGKYVYPAFNYESQKQRIAIHCPTHGIFRQQIGTHLQGKGCPKCSGSKGEAAISRWLSKNGFQHEAEYKVRMKNSRNPYRFDFYLPDRRLLIEYDGEQHFRPVTFGGMSESEALKVHNQIKRRDKKKNVWAKENGFTLLRVRYDEDVEHVLEAMVK